MGPGSYFRGAVKVNPQNMEQAITDLEMAWTKTFPHHIFEYQFLDETIARFYSEEKKLSQLVKNIRQSCHNNRRYGIVWAYFICC